MILQQGPSLTIGIEEEYQIIDPQTRELRSYITQILENDERVLREIDIKPEMHQSIIEVGSRVCHTPAEAKTELIRMRRAVAEVAGHNGLKIAASGAHPFSSWRAQELSSLEKHIGFREDMQELAQRFLIFGMHIHIGIEDREFLVDAMNVVRYMLPHLLCLSSSSPFWMGRKTGLKSYRSVVLRNLPRTGIPRRFESWADYVSMVGTLTKTNSITDGSQIWWDVRPNWTYPTLEIRICDVCSRVEEATAIAAIAQAIVAKLWKLRRDNMSFRTYAADLIEENKWRAVRYGLDGRLIDFGKQIDLPARELITELTDWFIDDVLDDLGSRQEVAYAQRILAEGTSADRQLATFAKTGSLQAVVDQIIAETNDFSDK
jgi:glutamate---cysteine ligase / carboxylate-amine ligase